MRQRYLYIKATIFETSNETIAENPEKGLLLFLSSWEMVPTRQRPLLKDILGARTKILWEEQLFF